MRDSDSFILTLKSLSYFMTAYLFFYTAHRQVEIDLCVKSSLGSQSNKKKRNGTLRSHGVIMLHIVIPRNCFTMNTNYDG